MPNEKTSNPAVTALPPVSLPAAIVSGGSAGLGRAITAGLLRRGYAVTVLGRDAERLEEARRVLKGDGVSVENFHAVVADATSRDDVSQALCSHSARFARLDVLVNVVGRSDRGRVESLEVEKLRELFDANVVSALVCSQACLPSLRQSRGVIVNIGSLASRVTPRYLGGYAIVKHALAAMSRQMRLECDADGVHVGLVCPGPIAGSHGENRYGVNAASGVPEEAARPGGGAKIKRLTSEAVAEAVLRCIDQRQIEVILPGKIRMLMAINAFSPSLADRILSRKTSDSSG